MMMDPHPGTWQERYTSAVMNTFGTPRLILERGAGSYVWDAEGHRYLDLLGGIAVTALGHAHPAIIAAITDQAARLGHVSNFFATPVHIRLAEELLRIATPVAAAGEAPAQGKVFLCNSGTEANEAAIKAVRRHGNLEPDGAPRATPRRRVLAIEGAFHGRSTGALALTHKAAYRSPFEPLPGGVEFLPFGEVDALERAMGQDVAGIIIEPIQGEAGVRPQPAGYIARARELCDQHGALLVLDEVQSGMGRTGAWLAHHEDAIGGGVVPDLLTLAKSLGGGMPIGACLALTPAAVALLGPGQHGTTFGGNPICAAAALAVIETIEAEGLLDAARKTGDTLRRGIENLGDERIAAVRGHGLLLGIELTEQRSAQVTQALQALGVIVNNANPTTIRLAPALTLTPAHVEEFLHVLTPALEEAWHDEQDS